LDKVSISYVINVHKQGYKYCKWDYSAGYWFDTFDATTKQPLKEEEVPVINTRFQFAPSLKEYKYICGTVP
jgi:hypothetical protein